MCSPEDKVRILGLAVLHFIRSLITKRNEKYYIGVSVTTIVI